MRGLRSPARDGGSGLLAGQPAQQLCVQQFRHDLEGSDDADAFG